MYQKNRYILLILVLSFILTFIILLYGLKETKAATSNQLSLTQPKKYNRRSLAETQFQNIRVKRAPGKPGAAAKGGGKPAAKKKPTGAGKKGGGAAAKGKGDKKGAKKKAGDKKEKADKTKKGGNADAKDAKRDKDAAAKGKIPKGGRKANGNNRDRSDSDSRISDSDMDTDEDNEDEDDDSSSSPSSSSGDDDELGANPGQSPSGFNEMEEEGAGYVVNKITRQGKQPDDIANDCANLVQHCTAGALEPYMSANCRGTCTRLGQDDQDVGQNCARISQLCPIYPKDMDKFCAATCHPEKRPNNNLGQFEGGGNTMESIFPQQAGGFGNNLYSK